MSLADTLASAAAQAQSVLAELTGEGTFTLSGDATEYTGVFNEFNELDPLTPTGIKQVRQLTIVATKAQFTTAPSAAPRRSLTAKGITWSVQSVTDMPQHYRLTCRPIN